MLLITTKIEWVTGKVNNTVLYVELFCHKKFTMQFTVAIIYLRVATIQGRHLLPPRAEANLQASL